MIERDNLSICKRNNKGLDCCCHRLYVSPSEKNPVESYVQENNQILKIKMWNVSLH